MSFVCPKCCVKSLKIIASIELPPDSRSDEIAVQITKCTQCGFVALAVYEESRRGALDSESVSHCGYYMKATQVTSFHAMIERCPEPGNPRCNCYVHSRLKCVDDCGRWNWLEQIPNKGSFKLAIA